MTTEGAARDVRALVDRFRELRVLVVGDAVLDVWLHGTSSRLSREGPVPVTTLNRRDPAPGGGANCAANAAALGASVHFLGIVGSDEDGGTLRRLLSHAGVTVDRVVVDPHRPTTVKRRLLSDGQLLARFDTVPDGSWDPQALDGLRAAFVELAADVDLVLVADYGDGALAGLPKALAGIRQDISAPVIVDGHKHARWRECRPTAMAPNADELLALVDLEDPMPDRIETLAAHSCELVAASGGEMLLTTLDAQGALLHLPDRPPHRTRAVRAAQQHTCGAGDTFTTTFGLALAAGATPEHAADLAQHAANIVVSRPGTAACSAVDLVGECTGLEQKVCLDETEVAARVAARRAAGHRVVFTNGCFDVLHFGHAQYLRQARALGDVLVVAVNSDLSVRRLKGPHRPIVPEAERAGLVAALESVDLVTLFDDTTPRSLIELLRPDVYVKGGDYTREMLPETEVVERVGGEVVTVDYLPNHSTTDLVQRIQDLQAWREQPSQVGTTQ